MNKYLKKYENLELRVAGYFNNQESRKFESELTLREREDSLRFTHTKHHNEEKNPKRNYHHHTILSFIISDRERSSV